VSSILPYLKAVFAFLVPAATTIGYAITDASEAGSHITQAEWIQAVIACVVTSGVVFAVPNKDPKGQHQTESTQPPNYGNGGLA
jgi:Sec-independent protein secretion pathway component TatC